MKPGDLRPDETVRSVFDTSRTQLFGLRSGYLIATTLILLFSLRSVAKEALLASANFR
jgi:hypothetical protein